MEKDKIFFAENGLTSTSANHIANLAKGSFSSVGQSDGLISRRSWVQVPQGPHHSCYLVTFSYYLCN